MLRIQRLKVLTRIKGNKDSMIIAGIVSLVRLYSNTESSHALWEEAGVLGREALHLRQQVLSNTHPDKLDSPANLITVYLEEAKWAEPTMALETRHEIDRLYQQTVSISQTVSSRNDPKHSVVSSGCKNRRDESGRSRSHSGYRYIAIRDRSRGFRSPNPGF